MELKPTDMNRAKRYSIIFRANNALIGEDETENAETGWTVDGLKTLCEGNGLFETHGNHLFN